MATKTYYSLALPTLLNYYNILGISAKELDLRTLTMQVSDLRDFSPMYTNFGGSYMINRESLSLLALDEEFRIWLENMCNYILIIRFYKRTIENLFILF